MKKSRTTFQGYLIIFFVFAGSMLITLMIWIKQVKVSQSYRVYIQFNHISTLKSGSIVKFKGANIGKVVQITPKGYSILVAVQIQPANVLIPKYSEFEANQAGVLGESVIDVTPKPVIHGERYETWEERLERENSDNIVNSSDLPAANTPAGTPLNKNCDSSKIVCHNDYVLGRKGMDYEDMVKTSTRVSQRLDSPDTWEQTLELMGVLKILMFFSTEFLSEMSAMLRLTRYPLEVLSQESSGDVDRADEEEKKQEKNRKANNQVTNDSSSKKSDFSESDILTKEEILKLRERMDEIHSEDFKKQLQGIQEQLEEMFLHGLEKLEQDGLDRDAMGTLDSEDFEFPNQRKRTKNLDKEAENPDEKTGFFDFIDRLFEDGFYPMGEP
uniref:ORF193 n=1 Tax=Gronococcus sybilensis TaxID=3028029 RepID=A0A9Y1I2F1_9RHOD|nr:ORF193 [Gronococcus sybilensis]